MNDFWAVVELMGHVTLGGRLTKPSETMNLFQIDIPEGEGFKTELFGVSAVYRIRAVSEEIARAYARPTHEIVAYDTPIVTREQHESELKRVLETVSRLEFANRQLRDRLTAVQGLPAPTAPMAPASVELPDVDDEYDDLDSDRD